MQTQQAKAQRRKARALARNQGKSAPKMDQAQADKAVRLRTVLAALAVGSDKELAKAARQRKKALQTQNLSKGQGLRGFWNESRNVAGPCWSIKA